MTKIGLIGFGTVGQSVTRILTDGSHSDVELASICNRNVEKKRVDWDYQPSLFHGDNNIIVNPADAITGPTTPDP